MNIKDLKMWLGYMVGGNQEDFKLDFVASLFPIYGPLETFKEGCSAIGTSKDSPEFRDELHVVRLHLLKLLALAGEKYQKAIRYETSDSAIIKLGTDLRKIVKEFHKAQALGAKKANACFAAQSDALLESAGQGEVAMPLGDAV